MDKLRSYFYYLPDIFEKYYVPFVLDHIKYMMEKEKPLRDFYENQHTKPEKSK